MAINPSGDARQIGAALARSVRHHWVLFLSEGIALVVLGLLAIFLPRLASIAATVVFGWILLLSGVIGLIATLRARHAPGLWWALLSAILGIVAGALLLGWPLQGVLSLTAVLIAFLLIEGVVSVFYALEHRRGLSGRWGWMLASGVVDLVLGAILFAGLPGTAVWALGLLIGVNMLFGGWALILMALAARTHGGEAAA
ncbi:MAG TPA: HdeD family acid-resistance protein [Steroidobacteraceae bacterium]|nr:HdeD family acid-resistance protein [Steroidobacteraceae bacterium]